jgi:hypothetical protein
LVIEGKRKIDAKGIYILKQKLEYKGKSKIDDFPVLLSWSPRLAL